MIEARCVSDGSISIELRRGKKSRYQAVDSLGGPVLMVVDVEEVFEVVAEGFHHGIGDHVGRFIGIFLRSRSTVVVASAEFLTTCFPHY